MPRVTFKAFPVVWVSMRGEERDGFPICLDDGGIYDRFRKFMAAENIFPARTSSAAGGGMFAFAFHPDDAEKVIAWLREQGAVQVSAN